MLKTLHENRHFTENRCYLCVKSARLVIPEPTPPLLGVWKGVKLFKTLNPGVVQRREENQGAEVIRRG